MSLTGSATKMEQELPRSEPDTPQKWQPHHSQQEFCYSRASYRQGKEYRAIKVYTIFDESRHLILQGVPVHAPPDDLRKLCQRFGKVLDFKCLNTAEYPPQEAFTSVYHVQYESFNHARYAKIRLDNRAFLGGIIHLCYAPEFETVQETRDKLRQRKRSVEPSFKSAACKRPFDGIRI